MHQTSSFYFIVRILLLSIAIFISFYYNVFSQNDADKKLVKILTKTESLFESKNYAQLWQYTQKSLTTYPDEKILHYGYACGIFYDKDNKKLKKIINNEAAGWKEIKNHLKKSKPLDFFNKKFSSDLQKEFHKLSNQELKDGHLSKAITTYNWWLDFFDNSTEAYKNKYSNVIQDSVFNYSKRLFMLNKREDAEGGFNWMYKTFRNSNFDYLYDGSDSTVYNEKGYLFEAYHNPKFILANTGKDEDYLSKGEKDLFYLINLLHMDVKLFKSTFVVQYQKDNAYSCDNSYFLSLMDELEEMKVRKLIYPDPILFQAAEFHANDMGKTGMISHNSSDGTECFDRIERFGGRASAECCSYGYEDPLLILMQLLIDNNVSSLGHRHSLLDPGFSRIGLSIRPHKAYEWNCVLDMGY